MIPELGQLALWAALAVALVLGTLPIAGAQSGRADWMALARPATGALALLITASFALLSVPAHAQSTDFDAELAAIQNAWATANYETPAGEPRRRRSLG